MENREKMSETINWKDFGLSKREFMAAFAMQGLLASGYNIETVNEDVIAEWAVTQADALLKALNKTCPQA